MIAVDIETTIEPRPRLAVLTIGYEDGRWDYEQCFGRTPSAKMLVALASAPWLTHNGTNFDIKVLMDHGVPPPVAHYDTLIGEAVLLTSGRQQIRKNLAAVQKRRLGVVTKGSVSHGSWMDKVLSIDQIAYLREDVLPLFAIMKEQQSEATRRGLRVALDNEQRLSVTMAKMAYHGLPIRLEALAEARQQGLDECAEADARLKATHGDKFNARSPKQVLKALERYHLDSTAKDILLPLADDQEVADILLVREKARLAGMYDDDWVKEYVYDGAIHPSYWQMGTDTTRFSASDPCVHQIPKSARHVFGGPDGTVFVKSDWSQLELRTFAAVTKDRQLIEDLENDVDAMRSMASFCYGMPQEDVSPDLRQDIKAMLYSWCYGGGRLAEQAVYTKIYAKHRLRASGSGYQFLRDRYPKAQVYRQLAVERMTLRQPIELPWGHIRTMTTGATPGAAIATEPQSWGAIALKEALLMLAETEWVDHLATIVHDEVVLGPMSPEEAQRAAPVLTSCMERAMDKVLGGAIKVATVTEIQERWRH